jgi:hypothetical protein
MPIGFAHPLLWIATVTLIASCASTTLVNQWRASDYRGGPFGNLLVVGISEQKGIRRTFEDLFVIQLRKQGVAATPGYRQLPSTGKADEQTLLEAVRDSGADGVLMTRVVSIDTETRYIPGYAGMWPYPGFYGYYASAWAYYEPPRVEQYKIVTLETNLWDMRTKSLVWSGTNRIFQPREIQREAVALVRVLVEALAQNGLIESPAPKKRG